ncbi:MAG: DNA mismatch repair endonuclease MutL, partial [Bacilli bacterium]|nr:DNA mismatch repair endonuclease MutL [Bacilli bacterium]
MGYIKLLDEQIISQIAAGEVIESVYSVIKELVENSIDAQATKIDISIIDNGLQLIQVVDNGKGMNKEDLLLCTKVHATSKISNQYDIFKIRTLGFRGEALASITSVSKTIISSNDGTNDGYEYDVFNNKLSIGYANKGCMVSAYNLFYNVPARYKFLCSSKRIYADIIDLIQSFALAFPQIAFNLRCDQNDVINSNGNGDMIAIINSIYGFEVASNMVEFSNDNSDFKINGYLSNKEVTRSNKNGIMIFINNRLIYDKQLRQSIIDGYYTLLMERRFPIVIIKITCDFQLIDVNVHPAKKEVRINKKEELQLMIKETITNKLKLRKPIFNNKVNIVNETLPFDDQPSCDNPLIKDHKINYPNHRNESLDHIIEDENKEITLNKLSSSLESDKPLDSDYHHEEKPSLNKVFLDVIGQFALSYIIACDEEGLCLIDQHAAMERINYERLKEDFNNNDFELNDLLV